MSLGRIIVHFRFSDGADFTDCIACCRIRAFMTEALKKYRELKTAENMVATSSQNVPTQIANSL